MFGLNPVSLTVDSDNAAFCWAGPEGKVLVERGGVVQLEALTSRSAGIAFHRWNVKSGNATFDDSEQGGPRSRSTATPSFGPNGCAAT